MLQTVSDEAAREAIELTRKLEETLATQPSIHTLLASTVRAARRAGKGIFGMPEFLDEAAWVQADGVALRVVRPPTPARGVYVHIHGGGWMLGGADMQDRALRDLARATGLVVASVEYRLAPEHPYPAAIDDCVRAARWVIGGGLDTPPWFAIGGESAGAHLSALVIQRVRGFARASLSYGMFDMSRTPSVRRWGDRNLVLSGPIIDHFVTALLPGLTSEQMRAPDISPLYGDCADMPPTLFQVGTIDPLLDDTLFMYERFRAAGNVTELKVWPHAVHGFDAFPFEIGRRAIDAQYRWLTER